MSLLAVIWIAAIPTAYLSPTTSRSGCGTVTGVGSNGIGDDAADGAEEAAVDASAVAESAGVLVHELSDLEALRTAEALFQEVWQSDDGAGPVSANLMRALSHAGGYVAGAYDGERMVAASLAFHAGGRRGLHSHISAVRPEMQGRNVGQALKLHQRAWALASGVRTVSWTFDPLLRRNAWFNVTKLGAQAVGYLVNFYGAMDDSQNLGDDSDRVVAQWDLEAPGVVAAARGSIAVPAVDDVGLREAHVALREVDGVPQVVRVPEDARCVLVQIPEDLQRLRLLDPRLARRWRESSRAALEPLLADRYTATGFTKSGWYVLELVTT